jgi:hypothetical protein
LEKESRKSQNALLAPAAHISGHFRSTAFHRSASTSLPNNFHPIQTILPKFMALCTDGNFHFSSEDYAENITCDNLLV